MKTFFLLTGLLFSFICFSQDPNLKNSSDDRVEKMKDLDSEFPSGTRFSFSKVSQQGAYNQFKQNLLKKEGISIIAEVDHAKNARTVGEELNETKILFFGNPNLGTPLMQKNQLAGLDLPQKVLFYKAENNKAIILYNSTAYLMSRHSLEGVATLDKISGALENMVSEVSKSPVENSKVQNIEAGAGIITKKSKNTFEETYSVLKNRISANSNIRIFAELDHQANAARVGLDLNPTKIIIFGNPKLGTPLMKEKQSIALDLPQKMLVWENDKGEVFVSYNDPEFISERHSLQSNKQIIQKISKVLDGLSNAAITN